MNEIIKTYILDLLNNKKTYLISSYFVIIDDSLLIEVSDIFNIEEHEIIYLLNDIVLDKTNVINLVLIYYKESDWVDIYNSNSKIKYEDLYVWVDKSTRELGIRYVNDYEIIRYKAIKKTLITKING